MPYYSRRGSVLSLTPLETPPYFPRESGHVLETGWAWAPPRLCIIFWHHRVNYIGRIGCDWPGTARGMHTSCSTGSTIGVYGVYGVEFSGDPRDDPGTVPCTKCTGSARHGREWCGLSGRCSVCSVLVVLYACKMRQDGTVCLVQSSYMKMLGLSP